MVIASSPAGPGIFAMSGPLTEIAPMIMQADAGHSQGGFDAGETKVPHLIYRRAEKSIGEYIELNDEIERRLATIVFFTYADALAAGGSAIDQGAIVEICVDRLMAQVALA